MVETTALSPHLGAAVTDVENLLDEATIARCLKALKWRGVLLTPHRTTVHGDEAFSG
jgi:hypothetical protein